MSTGDELAVAGPLPLWVVPGWRERFGVTAGITGRGSGVEPFDLGWWTDQPVGQVMQRWRSFRQALGECPAAVLAHQVHGTSVRWHASLADGLTLLDGADGHATDSRGSLLLVTVADCVPVYLVAPRQRAIALVHAGWRGTAGGIVAHAVRLLHQRIGATPGEIVMHAGVAISGAEYPVGAEVVDALGAARDGAGPWHVDLREHLRAQAAQLGIGEVTVSGRCTARDGQDFFSHRRSRGADGRSVAWLGLPA